MDSLPRQIKYNAYLFVIVVGALQRVPSRLFSNMAGIKDDITPSFQRPALHGFIDVPYSGFMHRVIEADRQPLAYFIRAYDCEVLTDFTKSSGERGFSNV